MPSACQGPGNSEISANHFDLGNGRAQARANARTCAPVAAVGNLAATVPVPPIRI
jgi:hypothetical protein